MAKKKDIEFNITSLDKMEDKRLNEIFEKVIKSKKGASALKSMMRSVMRSTLKSAAKSTLKSPVKSVLKSPLKSVLKSPIKGAKGSTKRK